MLTSAAKGFQRAYTEAFELAYAEGFCHERIVGKLSDFPGLDFTAVEGDFLIHGEDVILTQCPLPFHEGMADCLANSIRDALNNSQKLAEFDKLGAWSNWLYRNHLGCHKKQSKIADALVDICLNPGANYTRFASPISVEVAYHNESFFTLMVEAASWVNCYVDCEHSVALKIFGRGDERWYRLVIMARTELFDPVLALGPEPEYSPHLVLKSDGNEWRLKKVELERKFRTNIVYDHSFTEADINGPDPFPDFAFDLERVFKGSGFRVGGEARMDWPSFKRHLAAVVAECEHLETFRPT